MEATENIQWTVPFSSKFHLQWIQVEYKEWNGNAKALLLNNWERVIITNILIFLLLSVLLTIEATTENSNFSSFYIFFCIFDIQMDFKHACSLCCCYLILTSFEIHSTTAKKRCPQTKLWCHQRLLISFFRELYPHCSSSLSIISNERNAILIPNKVEYLVVFSLFVLFFSFFLSELVWVWTDFNNDNIVIYIFSLYPLL